MSAATTATTVTALAPVPSMMNHKQRRDQIIYLQRGLAESIAKGYSPVKAINLELEALYWIPSISMDGAMALVLEAARLNGMMIQSPLSS